jgi:hypothetical protein
MSFRLTIIAVLLGATTLLPAQPKKHKLPAAFGHAQYVYVESVDGDVDSPELLPEDRQAIADLNDAIYRWKRYILTARRSEADLVFLVRTGRVASARLGVGVGNVPYGMPSHPGVQTPIGVQTSAGSEVGPPDDFLQVCKVDPNGQVGTIIFERSVEGGLASPNVPMFKQLRDAVDKEYPLPPPKPKKP